MAFCCHHRCQWSSYVGREFFQVSSASCKIEYYTQTIMHIQEVGLTKSDFDVMCGMVSWAVCGTGKSREYRQQSEININQSARY